MNRPGWTTGNSLVIIITGSGERTAEAYNGDQAGAPLLHVEYMGPSSGNQPPVVQAGPDQAITLPDVAVLDGTVSDDGLPDGVLTSTWSLLNGSGVVTFTNASAVDTTVSFSSPGTYVLRLEADDGDRAASDEVTITVNPQTPVNTPPTVSIGTPSDGANFDQGEVIGFAGSASDGEDGDLTASLIWSSSVDGLIGTGGTFSRSDLSVGVHAITARVTDSEGSSGTDQITLIVHEVYTGPVVTIGTPSDGASFNEGETISFTGSASDGEDGDLTASLIWSSSLDGLIGTGGTFGRSDLSVGVHAITATVTDSEGLTAADQIVLTVGSSVTTLEVRVAASSDDAEERSSGGVNLTSSDLELVYDGSDQTVGIRFNGVTIPQGASIRNAYVQFQVDEFELRCDVADDRGGGYRQRRDVHVSGPKHLVAATHRGGDGLASRSLGDDRSIGSRSANAGYQLNRPGDCEPSRLDHGQLAGNHHHGEW